jgi:hypothetical protein
VGGLFSLETISFVVQKLLNSCSSICPSFLLVSGLLEFYWGILCLCLFPEYSLLFPILTSAFGSDIKVLNPLWVYTSTEW